ncbi:MAG: sensor histidine kinase [Terracidiphilus sp.]
MQQAAQVSGFNAGGPAVAGLAETAGAGEAALAAFNAGVGKGVRSERRRVEAVVKTLSNLRAESENLAEVAHDARNMVTALGLYCDLLEEPGVLNPAYQHYGSELRLVATASRRLVEKLVSLDAQAGLPRVAASVAHQNGTGQSETGLKVASRQGRAHRWDLMPAEPISDLAAELRVNRNLLAALAGPSIALTLEVEGGAQPVRLTGEDLTRILVNLVKNAAEAMPEGGSIRLGLRERLPAGSTAESLTLTVEDSGPGVPREALDKIFDSGYTTRAHGLISDAGRPAGHRGLGLCITRSILEAAGGSIHVINLVPIGARFEIDLPLRSR